MRTVDHNPWHVAFDVLRQTCAALAPDFIWRIPGARRLVRLRQMRHTPIGVAQVWRTAHLGSRAHPGINTPTISPAGCRTTTPHIIAVVIGRRSASAAQPCVGISRALPHQHTRNFTPTAWGRRAQKAGPISLGGSLGHGFDSLVTHCYNLLIHIDSSVPHVQRNYPRYRTHLMRGIVSC